MRKILRRVINNIVGVEKGISKILNTRIERELLAFDVIKLKYTQLLETKAFKYALENLDVLVFKLDEEVEQRYRKLHTMTPFEESLFQDLHDIKRQVRTDHLHK